MGSIVCALRGGPGSHYTRREALERTLRTQQPLYIIVVIPPATYNPLHEGEQRAIRAEMAWRELALARANAAQLGEPELQFNIQIRIGELQDAIVEFAESVEADVVLLGSPRLAPDATMTVESVDTLADELRQRLSIDVDVVQAPVRDALDG